MQSFGPGILENLEIATGHFLQKSLNSQPRDHHS